MLRTNLAEHHILAVANTLLRPRINPDVNEPLRVLDIGCGDARMMSYLLCGLSQLFPTVGIEMYGFDVSEQAYSKSGLMSDALALLENNHPHVDWESRLRVWPATQDWDFEDGFFDLAVSNQVLEHVQDLDHFLSNLKRCLCTGGQAIHLFPLRSHIVEAHTHMPFVHYFKDFENRVAFATFLTRVGLSRLRKDRAILGEEAPERLALDACKFLQSCTFYRNFADFSRKANEHSLSLSHRFTKDFYLQKMRQLLRAKSVHSYRGNSALWNFLSFAVLKYVSSVTLTMESIEYDVTQRIAREKRYDQEQRSKLREAA